MDPNQLREKVLSLPGSKYLQEYIRFLDTDYKHLYIWLIEGKYSNDLLDLNKDTESLIMRIVEEIIHWSFNYKLTSKIVLEIFQKLNKRKDIEQILQYTKILISSANVVFNYVYPKKNQLKSITAAKFIVENTKSYVVDYIMDPSSVVDTLVKDLYACTLEELRKQLPLAFMEHVAENEGVKANKMSVGDLLEYLMNKYGRNPEDIQILYDFVHVKPEAPAVPTI